MGGDIKWKGFGKWRWKRHISCCLKKVLELLGVATRHGLHGLAVDVGALARRSWLVLSEDRDIKGKVLKQNEK